MTRKPARERADPDPSADEQERLRAATLLMVLRAQEEMRAHSEWLRVTLTSIGDGVISTDAQGRVSFMNAVAESLTGWTLAEALGQPMTEVFRIVGEKDRLPVESPALRALREGTIVGLANHTILIAKDGTERPIDDSAAPVRNGNGEVVGAVLTFRDCSERRRAERDLLRSEARKSAMFEAAIDSIVTIDEAGRIVELNAAAGRTFGHRREDVVGLDLTATLLPRDQRAQRRRDLERYISTGKGPFERRIELSALRADGTVFPIELSLTRVGLEGSPLFMAFVRDLSEQARVEQALRASEGFSQSILDSSPDCIMALGEDGRLLSASGFCILDIDDFEPLKGSPWSSLWPHEWQADVLAAMDAARKGTRGRFQRPWISPKGAHKWWDVIVAPVHEGHGREVHFVAVLRDISDQKRAEHAFRESEQRFRVMADSAPVMIWVSGTEKLLEWFNKGWLDFVGRPLEAEIGDGWADNVHPEDLGACLASYLAAFDARRPFSLEFRLRRHDGEYRWMLDNGVPRNDSAGAFAGYVGSCVDISDRKAGELALARLAAIVESSDDAIVGKGLDGVISSWNLGAERMFGYPAEEAIGQHITLIIPAERRSEESEVLARIRRGEKVDHFETERIAKDGRRLNISLAVSPIKDAAGVIIGASKVARDITERRRAEQALRESEERFRTLADNMSQFAWTADAKGWIYWYNRRWHEYTGTTLEEAQGWGWKDLSHPDHVERVLQRAQRSWDTGEVWEDTFPLRGKDGQYQWFLSRAHPIRNDKGEVVQWFGTNTDVTEQRRLTEELRIIAARLSEANQRKDEFLATLAHELRNPLAPIRSAVELVRIAGDTSELVRSATEMMDRQISHMVRLVDDLLDVGRITRGKLELRRERVELAAVIATAVEATRPAIEAAGHEMSLILPPEPIVLDADPVRLSQVFSNLLNNACKYTERGGSGHIRLTVERRAGEVHVSVKDNGVGIPVEMLPRVFEAFTQVDRSLERTQGGLGIGLSIVKALVEKHEGNVSAHSEGPGLGSEFVVRLPLPSDAPRSDPPESARASGSRVAPSGDARRVLVVDDNRDAGTSLANLLRLAGHETVAAYDGEEAVEVAGNFRPHVVLLDIGLPKLNGYEAARKIRSQPWGKRMVLVALTGWGQEEDRRRSHAAGFDAHLVKPVEAEALITFIAECKQEPAAE